MSNWIKWDGGARPVEKGTLVDVEYRNKEVAYSIPALTQAFWWVDGLEYDIVAYRLSEVAEKIPEGWNKHDGKGMPVEGDVVVRVWIQGEDEESVSDADHVSRASNWGWNWYAPQAGCADIIYWKLVEQLEEVTDEEKHSHYFKLCPYKYIDVYRVLEMFNVTNPCLQHAAKKLLVAGGRGHKDIHKDVQDIIDTLERWKEMQKEGAGCFSKQL